MFKRRYKGRKPAFRNGDKSCNLGTMIQCRVCRFSSGKTTKASITLSFLRKTNCFATFNHFHISVMPKIYAGLHSYALSFPAVRARWRMKFWDDIGSVRKRIMTWHRIHTRWSLIWIFTWYYYQRDKEMHCRKFQFQLWLAILWSKISIFCSILQWINIIWPLVNTSVCYTSEQWFCGNWK